MSKPLQRYKGVCYKYALELSNLSEATRLNNLSSLRNRQNYLIFDSKLELDTFWAIHQYYDNNNIEIHQAIELMPKNIVFRPEKWKLDFIIKVDNKPFLYIESKGVLDRVARLKIKTLATYRPDIFSMFLLVVPASLLKQESFLQVMRKFNHCVALEDFPQWLKLYSPCTIANNDLYFSSLQD